MSEIITVRDGDIIAAEINVIKENAKRVMISSAIEIGRRLVEAKAVIDHGHWMKWLEEKVDYSQSTANNLMKLFQEYGTGEVNLFDNWTNSETFGKLTYTQHLALLALPFEDRAEFAENHQVAEMSTRELDKAVREEMDRLKTELAAVTADRDDANESVRRLNSKMETVEAERDSLEKELAAAKGRAKEAESEIQCHAKTADTAIREASKAKKDTERAENSEKAALDLVEKLKKDLAAAEEAEKKARKELAHAQEHPEIPESAMEEMRRQIEAEAAEKAAAEVKKKLEDARKVAQDAKLARAEAEEKLAALQKQTKISNPDIVAFQTMAQSMQQSYNDLNKYRLAVAERDADAGKRLAAFQRALLSQWIDILQEF